jgi:hydrogenase maturation protease
MRTVVVVGCGNPDRGDDGAGVVAVQSARPALRAMGVGVRITSSPLDLVELITDADAVVVVDAVRSGDASRPPGTILLANGGPRGLPAALRSSISSHGLGVGEAIGLASALAVRTAVVFVGVEAGTTDGGPLSLAVAAAMPDLVATIERAARGLLDGSNAPVSAGRPA